MISNILQPDLNNNLLRKYHTSGKLIIPLILPSLILRKYDVHPYVRNSFDIANILNIGYHSYVSTSCIITDYIKPKKISNITRIINLKSHTIATFGLMYYIFKSK